VSGAESARRVAGGLLLALALAGCSDALAEGLRATPPGTGPTVRWDLEARPLPAIPLPNDAATAPDPTSPTGRRLDPSPLAASGLERRLRRQLARLDGFSAYGAVTVAFDAPLDLDGLALRQGGLRFSERALRDHAIYLVDLEDGAPVPLDLGSGLRPISAAEPGAYLPNDPHRSGSNLLFETRSEDLDFDGVLDPGEDVDFDGVLDAPNTPDGLLRGTPLETYDRLVTFYERQTDTLVLRPLLPLRSRRRYAVVLTDRLRGLDGQPVRSPLPFVHPFTQTEALEALPALFAARPEVYGDLARRGFAGVAFAWTFTTQSTTEDLDALREGLYGRGPYARLADAFPADVAALPLVGGTPAGCDGVDTRRPYALPPARLRALVEALPSPAAIGFGDLSEAQLEAVLDGLERHVSHLAYALVEAPYLLGDPDAGRAEDTWDLDGVRRGDGVARDLVPLLVAVPRQTFAHRQPFDVALYAHGDGGSHLEALTYASHAAAQGLATVAALAPGHGVPADDALSDRAPGLCLDGLARALREHRAADRDGDGAADPAGPFDGGDPFHARDHLRQGALDLLQALRALRGLGRGPFAARRLATATGAVDFDGDLDGDGAAETAGDFDADGVSDLGTERFAIWGSGFGAVRAMLAFGVEPALAAAAPVSGGGGWLDVALRSRLPALRDPLWLRLLGPVVASRRSSGPGVDTSCAEGARSLHFVVPDQGARRRVELACLEAADLDEGDVVVLTNLRTGARRCAGVGPGGRFTVAVPTDVDDALELRVLDGGAADVDYGRCAGDAAGAVARVVDAWEVGAGGCRDCGRYQDRRYEAGTRLRAPIAGLGLDRQSPDLRRVASWLQAALDPADPIHYARRAFLEPPMAPDVEAGPRAVFVVATAGDTAVPVSAADAYARAAGLLPFVPADGPSVWREHRAPETFAERYGRSSPDAVLRDFGVLEGLASLERFETPFGGVRDWVVDVEDLSDGVIAFDGAGDAQRAVSDGGISPRRLDPPLRWSRRSEAGVAAPWNPDGGVRSALLHPMPDPRGRHVLPPPDPTGIFDDSAYVLNAIGWFLASGGAGLPWLDLAAPSCLAVDRCRFLRVP
jgi:hypothetical protein